MMAFFGLTQLGYQDTIREHVKEPKTTPISAFRSGTYRDADYRLPKPEQCDFPPSDELPGTRQDPTARYERGPCASQQKLDHNKTAGIMCPKGMLGQLQPLHKDRSFPKLSNGRTPSLSSSPFLSPPYPTLFLEVGPLNTARGSGGVL